MTTKQDYNLFLSMADAVHVRLDIAARRMMKDANLSEAVAIGQAIFMHVCLYGKKKAAA